MRSNLRRPFRCGHSPPPGVVALLPAATILPKSSGGAVWLADATFDHAKIAIIDAMARLGLPPVNPVIGEAGAVERLSLLLSLAFQRRRDCARHVDERLGSRRRSDVVHSVRLAQFDDGSRRVARVNASPRRFGRWRWLRPVRYGWRFIGCSKPKVSRRCCMPPIGMGGWLFQATWVPQHLMAASCVVAALLLVTRYALQQSLALVVTIALLVVAGFESSAFIGGIAFAVAGLIAAPILLCEVDRQTADALFRWACVAALLVVCLIAPFVRDQLAAIAARGARRAHCGFALCSVR